MFDENLLKTPGASYNRVFSRNEILLFQISLIINAVGFSISHSLIKTVRLQCVQPTLPKYFSASEFLFLSFNCHVTALNLFNDRNCDVFAKVLRSAVVEKVF